MYLVYMNFVNDNGQYKSVHVVCQDRHEARQIVGLGKQRGLTVASRIAQYALFEADTKINTIATAQASIYTASEFDHRWQTPAPQPPRKNLEQEHHVIDLADHRPDKWGPELDTWSEKGYDLITVVERGPHLYAFLRKR